MSNELFTYIFVALLVVWIFKIIAKARHPTRHTQPPPWRHEQHGPPLFGGHIAGDPMHQQSQLFETSHHTDTLHAHTYTPDASDTASSGCDGGSSAYDNGPATDYSSGSSDFSSGSDFSGGGSDFSGGGDFGGGGSSGSWSE